MGRHEMIAFILAEEKKIIIIDLIYFLANIVRVNVILKERWAR